jgi:hypothetical protein
VIVVECIILLPGELSEHCYSTIGWLIRWTGVEIRRALRCSRYSSLAKEEGKEGMHSMSDVRCPMSDAKRLWTTNHKVHLDYVPMPQWRYI